SREEVKRETGLDPGLPTLLVTLHPETLTPDLPLERQYTPLLEALASLTSYQVVITAPAAEEGAPAMIAAYKAFAAKYQHVIYFPHLGSRNYLAVMKFSMVVVGNSSSGLTEAPSMGVPTVNIGNRQKNRMAAKGVIHCGYDRDEILQAIALAATEAHRILCRNATNPYDPYRDGMNSLRAARAITAFLSQCSLQRQIVKQFDTNTNPEQWNSLLK
ncbi:MAG: UDP-N-acetylglucosamine 2-epimerase, partial [Dehalococcoidales bacterium]|nr:UDP-N-acetylglucosamine 2-epimerase [Dehalococcoidales bacterium]